jgi:hypothetical protein
MNHLKRRWRRWLVVLLLLAGLIAGGRWFLSSPYVTGRAAATLEKLYGGRVRVGSASIGTNNTVLNDVQLFERDQGPGQEPWLTIDRLETDVSLWDLVSGTPPTQVILNGVTVRLRFDAEGRLLTTLPPTPKSTGPAPELPDVQLTDGRVLLLGVDGRQLIFDKVEATLKAQGASHVFAGSGHNAAWGQSNVAGTLDPARNSISAELKSDKIVHVTQTMLEGLPVVPANVWRQVQLDGDTTITVKLANDGGPSVSVALAPTGTHLRIPAVDLETFNTSGAVDIADGKIALRKMQGQFASGTLTADLDLEFPKVGLRINILQLGLDNVDLRALPGRWSIPPQLQGRVHASAKLQMTIADGKMQTRGTGQGEIRQATIGGQSTNQPILLTIADVKGTTCLIGQFSLPVTDLPALATAFEVKLPPEIKGRVALAFRTEFPLDTITDPLTYRASGHSLLEPLQLAGLSVDPLDADWAYKDGDLKLHTIRGNLAGGKLTGHAVVHLQAPFSFEAKLYPDDINLAAFDKLDAGFRPPVQIAGTLTASAELSGTLRPFTVLTKGTAAVKDFTAAGWMVTEAKASWHSDADKLLVDEFEAKAYDGSIRGTASLPLSAATSGTFQLHLADIDAGRLGREQFGASTRVEGKVSGVVEGRIAKQAGDRPRDVSVALDLRSPRLGMERVSAEKVALVVRYRHGSVHYHLDGRMLGGTVELQGELNVADQQQAYTARPGHLRLAHIEVDRLLALCSNAGEPLPMRGTLDADLRFRLLGKELTPLARGRVLLTGLAWQDQTLAAAAQADLIIDHQEITLRDFTATVGQGILSGKLVVNLSQPQRSWFTAALDGADLTTVLQPWPELAQHCQGTVDLRLRGKLGKECSGSCDAVLIRAKIAGLAVNEWRLPIRWSLVPSEGRGHLEIHDSHLQVSGGTGTLDLSAGWNSTLRLDSQLRFVGVDLRQAFPGLKLGNGRANGRLDISGDHMRSLDDVGATLQATFQQTQAMQFPVLRQIAPILGFQSSSTFQNGDLRARLARSVVHIERMTFYEGPLQLYADGNVTLQGRVLLDVTANTGKLTNVAAALGWRLPAGRGIAGELLAKATTALSPRLVHLHVTGTVHEPIIQVVPLPMLTEQALRFFGGL